VIDIADLTSEFYFMKVDSDCSAYVLSARYNSSSSDDGEEDDYGDDDDYDDGDDDIYDDDDDDETDGDEYHKAEELWRIITAK
jgi:hypothetical protein